MSNLFVKSLKAPEQTRSFAGKGHLDIVKVGEASVGCATFEPGWRWSEHVKPLTGTDSCESAHTGYCLAGRMLVRMDSGEEQEIRPGDAFLIEPGHDAWVVGQEPCVLLDFSGYEHYLERRTPAAAQNEEAFILH